MHDVASLCHSVWNCKYLAVWIPKYRRKALYGQIRKRLGEMFHDLARQRERKILEGHLASDHVHMYIEVPPKCAVAQVIEFIKGKSAINVARTFGGASHGTSPESISGLGDTSCPRSDGMSR